MAHAFRASSTTRICRQSAIAEKKELAGLDYSGESFVVGERLRLAPCGRRQQSVQRFIVQLNRIALAFHR